MTCFIKMWCFVSTFFAISGWICHQKDPWKMSHIWHAPWHASHTWLVVRHARHVRLSVPHFDLWYSSPMHFWTFWCCCFRQNAKPWTKNRKNTWENPMEKHGKHLDLSERLTAGFSVNVSWPQIMFQVFFNFGVFWNHGFLQVLEPGWLEVNLDFAEYLEAELEDGHRDTVPMEMSIWMYWQVQYLLNVATEASLEQVSLEAKCWVKTVEFHFLPLFEAKTFRHKSRRNIQRVILRDFYVVFCALVKPDVFVVSLTSSHAELPGFGLLSATTGLLWLCVFWWIRILGSWKSRGSVQTPRWNPMMLPWLCYYGWSYGSLTPKIIDPKEGKFDETQRSHVPTNFTDDWYHIS